MINYIMLLLLLMLL
ncbi:unnamed protein product [Larinioides sclopetarius]|uniref:Uncharacterized protein n=1 Tax=Larinioides sclopetarius TaxID=280406 RepID=A0AAV2AHP6_9ARAC